MSDPRDRTRRGSGSRAPSDRLERREWRDDPRAEGYEEEPFIDLNDAGPLAFSEDDGYEEYDPTRAYSPNQEFPAASHEEPRAADEAPPAPSSSRSEPSRPEPGRAEPSRTGGRRSAMGRKPRRVESISPSEAQDASRKRPMSLRDAQPQTETQPWWNASPEEIKDHHRRRPEEAQPTSYEPSPEPADDYTDAERLAAEEAFAARARAERERLLKEAALRRAAERQAAERQAEAARQAREQEALEQERAEFEAPTPPPQPNPEPARETRARRAPSNERAGQQSFVRQMRREIEDAPAEAAEPAPQPGVSTRKPPKALTERRAAAREKLRGTPPFSGEERMLAGRYLRARRKEGFISVIAALSLLGIALGVATLIIVMSVMNGFRAELVAKIVGVNGHLMVAPINGDFPDYEVMSQDIGEVPGVVRAAPLIEAQAFASTPANGQGVLVRGLRKQDILTLEKVAVSPERSAGSLASFGQGAGIAIGERLAYRLRVGLGDKITLISPRGPATPFGVIPRKKSYEVTYIFKVGMAHYDEGVAFMPLEEAQAFFNRPETVDAIEVMVATPERLKGYREDIQDGVNRPIVIHDWIDNNRSLIGALKMERSVMFLILSMLILIASLIIISGMIMLVKEKGRDIAILRTMGMSRGGVLRVFFMCGASIGLVGTIAGVALGLVFCWNIDQVTNFVSMLSGGDVFPEDIYILSRLPAKVHAEDVIMTVAISLGLSFIATLYPAWRAARIDPVEALRYE